MTPAQLQQLSNNIKQWGASLGFDAVAITNLDPGHSFSEYQQWLEKGYAGEMSYLHRHQELREDPGLLHPGSQRVIVARVNYLPEHHQIPQTLSDPSRAYISRYALGRDYHKLLRKKLKQLGDRIKQETDAFIEVDFRPFVDSAPIMERPLAENAGLGWGGKHTLLIHPENGSFFFLGELLINLPLPVDQPIANQCGSCSACLQICPTGAIVAPYELDARRCISYLTIEQDGAIPLELRPLIGNRIYGCDDCQLICPWNRFAKTSSEPDFMPRHQLDSTTLLALFAWSEAEFLQKTEGSAIRRIGFQRWQRNIAVALGNAPFDPAILTLLRATQTTSELVQEHIDWAIAQQKRARQNRPEPQRKLERLLRILRKTWG